jgi:hypothetical protein
MSSECKNSIENLINLYLNGYHYKELKLNTKKQYFYYLTLLNYEIGDEDIAIGFGSEVRAELGVEVQVPKFGEVFDLT